MMKLTVSQSKPLYKGSCALLQGGSLLQEASEQKSDCPHISQFTMKL